MLTSETIPNLQMREWSFIEVEEAAQSHPARRPFQAPALVQSLRGFGALFEFADYCFPTDSLSLDRCRNGKYSSLEPTCLTPKSPKVLASCPPPFSQQSVEAKTPRWPRESDHLPQDPKVTTGLPKD